MITHMPNEMILVGECIHNTVPTGRQTSTLNTTTVSCAVLVLAEDPSRNSKEDVDEEEEDNVEDEDASMTVLFAISLCESTTPTQRRCWRWLSVITRPGSVGEGWRKEERGRSKRKREKEREIVSREYRERERERGRFERDITLVLTIMMHLFLHHCHTPQMAAIACRDVSKCGCKRALMCFTSLACKQTALCPDPHNHRVLDTTHA